jgi:hypothetical protein
VLGAACCVGTIPSLPSTQHAAPSTALLAPLPPRLAAVRDRIRDFVAATFPDFAKNGCAFPF